MRFYPGPTGDTNLYPDKEQAEVYKRGMAKMPKEFVAKICSCCGGRGQYEQTYTHGCGMGTYRSQGPCGCCKGWGLVIGNKPAPRSVLNQVLEAAGAAS